MSIVFASDESVQASGFQAFYGVDCDVQVPLSIALANCGKARRHASCRTFPIDTVSCDAHVLFARTCECVY
jgi:hypothetical protein